jgi:hypothetical protein
VHRSPPFRPIAAVYGVVSEQWSVEQVFDGVACRMVTPTRVSYGGATEQVSGELVSGSFFPMLRVRPIIGRLFSREDDRTVSGAPYAVLASALLAGAVSVGSRCRRQERLNQQ